jgi:uncharacterized cupin superfamily protein
MAAGHARPAEHVHIGHDEAFFVISGQLKFRVGDGYRTAVSGETVFASRGLAHGFWDSRSENPCPTVGRQPHADQSGSGLGPAATGNNRRHVLSEPVPSTRHSLPP